MRKTKTFDFPEIDKIGIENLESISFAPRFNEYMYDTIKNYCTGNILEIGSGTGNISQFFIRDKAIITLSDIRQNYIDTLKQKFNDYRNISFKKIDLTDIDFENKHKSIFNSYDTLFALNVVEHIEDDSMAIANAKKLLKPNGKIIILVPAFNTLYNSFDKALEHYRRYTKSSLTKLLENEFDLIESKYFNVFGMLGWFVSGSLIRKKSISKAEMITYDKLIIISKFLDKLFMNKIGLSVIAVGINR